MNYIRLAFLAVPFLLIGCSAEEWESYKTNYPMPTGYAYNSANADKTETPPSDTQSQDVSIIEDSAHEQYSPPTLPPQTHGFVSHDMAWQKAADDLIGRMIMNFGQPMEPVHIHTAGRSPNASFETALRTAMEDRGMTVASMPGMGPFTLQYSGTAVDPHQGGRTLLTVTLMTGDKMLIEESGIYSVKIAENAPSPKTSSYPQARQPDYSRPAPALPTPQRQQGSISRPIPLTPPGVSAPTGEYN